MIAAMQTKGHGRGKSGLRRAGCQITSGGGNSRDSATEIYRVSNEAGVYGAIAGYTLACKTAYRDIDMRRMPRNEECLHSEYASFDS